MLTNLSNAYNTLLAFQNAVDNASRSDYFGRGTTNRGTAPRVNLYQREEDTVLMAEIPGIKKEDITIEIKENLIRIAAKRTIQYEENANVHRLERRGFDFDRSLRLPHRVETDKVKADYEDGILRIVLPKAEIDKPKQIEIN